MIGIIHVIYHMVIMNLKNWLTILEYLIFKCVNSHLDTCPGVNALPLRAYIQIYNDYYRDQNLQSEIVFPKTSTNESVLTANGVYKIKKRCWEKDYFTAALPFSQRGDEVRVPIMGEIPVFGNNNNIVLKTSTGGYPSGSIVGNGANGHIEDIDNDVLKFPKRTDAEDPFWLVIWKMVYLQVLTI